MDRPVARDDSDSSGGPGDVSLFERIANAVPQLICSFSPEGEYLFLNQAMRAYSGLSLPLRHGMGLRSMVHPVDLERLDPVWHRAFTNGEPLFVDVRLRSVQGRYRWFEMTATPVRTTDGVVISWYTSATDVNERRVLTDDLHLVLDAFPGLISLWDHEQRNRYANAAYERVFGVAPAELRGRHLSAVPARAGAGVARADLDRALRGEPQHLDREIETIAGQVRQVQTSLIPVRRDDELQGVLVVDLDVTEARDAAARLDEAEDRFELAFEQSPVGIALLGIDGAFFRVNQSMARMFACAPEQLIGKTLADLVVGDSPDESELSRPQLLRGEVAQVARERRGHRGDGTSIELRISESLVRDRSGRALYFVMQFEDIGERKQVGAELQRINEDLKRSNEDLERFAYVASHDLQEPLRTISSYTQLLATRYREHLDERGMRYIDYAVDAAQRMQQLISGLLDLSRLGRDPLPRHPVDLSQLVASVVRLLANSVTAANAHVVVETLPVLPGNQDQLVRVFQNLIGNALKFAAAARPPEIRISAAVDGAGWQISIRDNGIGIDPQYRERVFLMFQRLHTRHQYQGSGIGLAVVKRIVELHQGRIWIGDLEGPGTVFHLWLPA